MMADWSFWNAQNRIIYNLFRYSWDGTKHLRRSLRGLYLGSGVWASHSAILSHFISTPSVYTLYEHLIPQLRPTPDTAKPALHQALPLTLSTAQRTSVIKESKQHGSGPQESDLLKQK